MRKSLLTIAIAALALTVLPMNSLAADENGHVLSSLWSEYDKAEAADLPKKSLAALEKIKKEALSKKLPYDFYDAAVSYVDVATRRNWKLRDSLDSALTSEIDRFGNPSLTFHYMSAYQGASASEMWTFVKANKSSLSSSKLDIFYEDAPYFYMYSPCDEFMPSFIGNDYELALWTVYARCAQYWNEESSEVGDVLKKYIGSSYPKEAVYDFAGLRDLRKDEERAAALEGFMKKYKGKAAGLLFEEELLSIRFRKLSDKNASSKEFKDFHEECLDFEKRRAAFKGEEKEIASACRTVEALVEQLESKEISLSVLRDEVTVSLRNLPSVKLSLLDKDEKVLKTYDVENKAGSFYVLDTVKVDLGALDDGTYSLKAVKGDTENSIDYNKKTLSIGWRQGPKSNQIYVAEYLTGRPLEKVKLELYKGEKLVYSESSFALNGFTYLPASLEKLVESNPKSSYELVCSDIDGGRLRKTNPVYISKYFFGDQPSASVLRDGDFANLMLDCSAFHPGDEVRFKAVLYTGNSMKAYRVFSKGKSVEARLLDPSGEVVAKKTLKTNEMGSVASSFKLEKLSHNGFCSIQIRYGTRVLAVKSFDVDDFVLPTFEIKFDKAEEPLFAGEKVVVKGSVKSYSGHNLASARVSYTINRWGETSAEGPLDLAKDGSFAISFDSKRESGYYNVTVKVVDATGETLEKSSSLVLSEAFDFSMSVVNKADANFERLEGDKDYHDYSVVSDSDARVTFDAKAGGLTVPVKISYKVLKGDKTVLSGETTPGGEVSLALKEEGDYLVKYNATHKTASGREIKVGETFRIIRVNPDSSVISFECENFFMMKGGPEDEIAFNMGASGGEVWAIAELFDVDGRFISSQKIHLGKGNKSLMTVTFPFRKDYSDAVAVRVFYFRNGRSYNWTREFHRPAPSINPPLVFSRFEDKALPGAEYTVTLQAWKGAEALLAVFDKSTETICSNNWWKTGLSYRSAYAPYVNISCGSAESRSHYRYMNYAGGAVMMTKASLSASKEMVVEEECAVFDSCADNAGVAGVDESDMEEAAEVSVREDFADVLAFEPFVRTKDDGSAEITFRTSDKLSTYIVSAYAHDASMNNNFVRSEMKVTIPVKVSLVQPQVLYRGDHYVASALVSSLCEETTDGKLMLFAYDKASYDGEAFVALKKEISVEPGGSMSVDFPIDVPKEGIEALGLKLVFAGDTYNDAIFVSSPVKPRSQVLTEAHSGVLLGGMSEEDLLARLRSEFTGTTPYGAEYGVRNIYDMVLDAIPSRVDPSSENVLSLSEALYVRKVASLLSAKAVSGKGLSDAALVSKILECRNGDGGFGWFEGMNSSPIITAVLLDRFHRMASREVLPAALASTVEGAVKFLDESYFKMKKRPWWCGWLRLEQYLYIRSEFASVPFTAKLSREFKKESKEFLFPKKSRIIAGGSVYSKVRRASVLARLLEGDGKKLAKAWGLGSSIDRKVSESLEADILSLSEYAVDHRNGGIYYPNMVSPYGGLLESQLYTHVALLDLLDLTGKLPEVADGVRLWMLLLKETQEWDAEVCYIDAIAAILDGSENLKATKVIVLKKTYEKPLEEIVPAGNGMKIERAFFRVSSDGKKTQLKEGDPLTAGDKIVAEYRVWSEEYRSFVRISAPRPGCLTPVDQLSGRYGWRFSPIRAFAGGAIISVSPCGYRDSRFDRSEYWFDCFPEEKTTITEEFYVTQKGTFALPALEVESLYAPHYRANSSAMNLRCTY